MITVATIIVTYNRKELLLRCLKAVTSQSYKPNTIYIIDNNSTDGTDILLNREGYINIGQEYNGINIKYVKLPINGGGSMGFYEGLKRAYNERKYDFYWVMDDDGMPDYDCLRILLSYRHVGEYLSPLVVDINTRNTLAFGKNLSIKDYVSANSTDGEIILNYANPFNGILYSKKYIEEVGFPEPKMFIWGDEINYDIRGRKKNLRPCIICKAIQYHPQNRAQFSPTFFFGLKKVIWVNCKWKMYCRCCNAIYNYKLEKKYIQIIKEFFLYNWLFIVTMHSWQWTKLYNKAFFNGLLGKFGGYSNYM